MGLGKTIQVLSVVLCNSPHNGGGLGGGVIAGDAGQEVQEEEMKVGGEVEGGWRDAEEREEGVVEVEEATLVVCPMSVITSWESQVKQ